MALAPDAGGAALAYGLAAPLGGSGFIAAFVAGLVFGAARRPRARVGARCPRSSSAGCSTP